MPRTRRSRAHDEAALPAAWLAVRLGVEPRVIESRRRAGELLGVRGPDGADYLYPLWQFDAEGRPSPAVARVVQEARRAGIGDEALYELLRRRQGMRGGERLVDVLRAGREDRVLEVVRAEARKA
jgi:hypothetical protein